MAKSRFPLFKSYLQAAIIVDIASSTISGGSRHLCAPKSIDVGNSGQHAGMTHVPTSEVLTDCAVGTHANNAAPPAPTGVTLANWFTFDSTARTRARIARTLTCARCGRHAPLPRHASCLTPMQPLLLGTCVGSRHAALRLRRNEKNVSLCV